MNFVMTEWGGGERGKLSRVKIDQAVAGATLGEEDLYVSSNGLY